MEELLGLDLFEVSPLPYQIYKVDYNARRMDLNASNVNFILNKKQKPHGKKEFVPHRSQSTIDAYYKPKPVTEPYKPSRPKKKPKILRQSSIANFFGMAGVENHADEDDNNNDTSPL